MRLELQVSQVYTWAMMLPEPYQICHLEQSLRPDFKLHQLPEWHADRVDSSAEI